MTFSYYVIVLIVALIGRVAAPVRHIEPTKAKRLQTEASGGRADCSSLSVDGKVYAKVVVHSKEDEYETGFEESFVGVMGSSEECKDASGAQLMSCAAKECANLFKGFEKAKTDVDQFVKSHQLGPYETLVENGGTCTAMSDSDCNCSITESGDAARFTVSLGRRYSQGNQNGGTFTACADEMAEWFKNSIRVDMKTQTDAKTLANAFVMSVGKHDFKNKLYDDGKNTESCSLTADGGIHNLEFDVRGQTMDYSSSSSSSVYTVHRTLRLKFHQAQDTKTVCPVINALRVTV